MAVINEIIRERARKAVELVSGYGAVRAAFLFGSQVNGHADEFSDIDIAAFIEGLGEWDLDRRVRVSVEVQKRIGDDVELHLFPAETMDNPLPASFAEYVKSNGVRIAE